MSIEGVYSLQNRGGIHEGFHCAALCPPRRRAMTPSVVIYEVIGHAVVLLTFLATVVYVAGSRRILRRSVRRASFLFWFILAVGIVSSILNIVRIASLLSNGAGVPASVIDVAA